MFTRLAVLCCALLIAGAALAEVPNRSVAQLTKSADVIVVGSVTRIFTATEKKEGGYTYTYYVAQISVSKTEKGEAGAVTYAHYWRRSWAGKGMPPVGTSGHRGLPKKGDAVRAYLQKGKDGSLQVTLPNGITVDPK